MRLEVQTERLKACMRSSFIAEHPSQAFNQLITPAMHFWATGEPSPTADGFCVVISPRNEHRVLARTLL